MSRLDDTTQKAPRRPPSARGDHMRRGDSGYSIVELMIALCIGLAILLMAAIAVAGSNRELAQTRELEVLGDTKEHVTRTVSAGFLNAGHNLVRYAPAAANSTTYKDEVLADDPLLYWRLDEPADSPRVNDSSPNGIGGAVTGTVNFAQAGALTSDPDTAASMGVTRAGGASGNIARNMPATQSSTGWDSDASRAVDGNTDGNWYNGSVSHTDYNAQAWWQVDLGSAHQISKVDVYLMTVCCSSHQNFDVKVSADGSNWQSFYVPGPVDYVSVPVGAQARYVRVQLRDTYYLALAEVEVYEAAATQVPGGINSDSFATPAGDFSVEWWLNPTRLANYNQLITDTGWGTWVFHTTAEGSLFCGTDNWAPAINPSDVAAATLRVGVWHHFVFTYQGTTGSLYLNGILLARKTLARPQNWHHLNLYSVEGSIDEVALYNRALSPERLRAHYAAGVAPPVPQADTGFSVPVLPLTRWRSAAYEQPDGPVTIAGNGSDTLLISADDDFSPTQLESPFTPSADAAARPLRVREGVRSSPRAGDYLLLIDYDTGRSALVRVTAEPTPGASAFNKYTNALDVPVETVTTANPAWKMMYSADGDLAHTFPDGATVVRLSPPVTYRLSGTHLVRSSGASSQTLALGATKFSVTPSNAGGRTSWTVDLEVAGEGVEASSDAQWNQRASASLLLAPYALNPGL